MATLTSPAVSNRKLLTVAPMAGIIAAIINVGLFLLGTTTGLIPTDFIIPNAGQPLTVLPVLVASFVPALVAGLGLAVLNRLTKHPLRIFNVLALAILLFSFASPFSIPNVPFSMIVILELMHVVVIGVVMYVFNRYAKQ